MRKARSIENCCNLIASVANSGKIPRISLEWLFIFLFLTVQTLLRESQVIREAMEKQIVELKKMCEKSTESLNNEWEKRVMNNASKWKRTSVRIHFVALKKKK